jgi:hypothetical protein
MNTSTELLSQIRDRGYCWKTRALRWPGEVEDPSVKLRRQRVDEKAERVGCHWQNPREGMEQSLVEGLHAGLRCFLMIAWNGGPLMNRGSFRTPLEPFSFAQYPRLRRRARARFYRCYRLPMSTRTAIGVANKGAVDDSSWARDGTTDSGEVGMRSGNGFDAILSAIGMSTGRGSTGQKRLTRLLRVEDGCTETRSRRGETHYRRLKRDQHSPRHSSLTPLTLNFGFTMIAEVCLVY